MSSKLTHCVGTGIRDHVLYNKTELIHINCTGLRFRENPPRLSNGVQFAIERRHSKLAIPEGPSTTNNIYPSTSSTHPPSCFLCPGNKLPGPNLPVRKWVPTQHCEFMELLLVGIIAGSYFQSFHFASSSDFECFPSDSQSPWLIGFCTSNMRTAMATRRAQLLGGPPCPGIGGLFGFHLSNLRTSSTKVRWLYSLATASLQWTNLDMPGFQGCSNLQQMAW